MQFYLAKLYRRYLGSKLENKRMNLEKPSALSSNSQFLNETPQPNSPWPSTVSENTKTAQKNLPPKSLSRTASFEKLKAMVFDSTASPLVRDYLMNSSDRLIHMLDLLQAKGVADSRICELGPAGVGLACAKEFGASVDAFDCVEHFFKPIYTRYNVPVHCLDLNKSARVGYNQYDLVLFCEVFEHLIRWPLDTLIELRESLVPGGYLLLTTQNLHRLSNRLRMVFGRNLFVQSTPENLLMGHLREYSASELVDLLNKSGFENVHFEYVTWPDLKSPRMIQKSYSFVCKCLPRLSNFVYCWAQRPQA